MTLSNVKNSANREREPSRKISSARSGGAVSADVVESGTGRSELHLPLTLNGSHRTRVLCYDPSFIVRPNV